MPLEFLVGDDAVGRIVFQEQPPEKPRKNGHHRSALEHSQFRNLQCLAHFFSSVLDEVIDIFAEGVHG